MTTEVLKKTTAKYLCGQSEAAEKDRIQTWLSCTGEKKTALTREERELIENEIVGQVNAYVTSSLFIARTEPWWKKITAFF